MKKLILAMGCIAAISTFAACTADNVNDFNSPKSNQITSKVGKDSLQLSTIIIIDTTGGDDGKGIKH